MMIRYLEEKPDIKDYLELRKSVGFHDLSPKQAEIALDNALKIVAAYDGNEIVGMGRLVGDGAVICYIQDIMIRQDHRGCGIGAYIIKRLVEYTEEITLPGTKMMLGLMSKKGSESFYEKFGFIKRPNDELGNGFTMYIFKEDTK